jgi:hypothetical protein
MSENIADELHNTQTSVEVIPKLKLEEYPRILQITDEMQVLKNHRHDLTTSLVFLGKDIVNDLTQKIHDVTPMTIRHPQDRYIIPVTSPHIDKEIISPIPIQFVSRKDELVFQEHQNYHAFYSPERGIVFMDRANFSTFRRIEGWLCGVEEAGCAFEEEVIEHEIRHSLFYKATKDFTPRVRPINEGYARAQLGGWWLKDIAWGMRFEGYKDTEAHQTDRYYQLFRLAQSKDVDDFSILEFMAKNRWWIEKGSYDIDENIIETQILHHLGENNTTTWLQSANLHQDQLLKWRYSVWEIIHPVLLEHNLDPVKNWADAISEEKYIREQYPED